MRQTLRVGIVGGTGYAGAELVRLLAAHPYAEVGVITSRTDSGKPVAGVFPNLRGHTNLLFRAPEDDAFENCDVVFFATPHGVAMESTPRLLEAGARIIDLSGDFRLQDPVVWAQWYGKDHACPEYLTKAVYGLPEVNRSAIATAPLVAVPGCYPTAIQIGFIPLLESNLIDPDSLTAAAMSGVSGAGRQASIENLLTECSDSVKAYSVAGHRHLPEIEQGLQHCSVSPIQLTFVPHLAPMVRGIHATLTARLTGPATDIQELFEARYHGEPAVDVMPAGSHPQTRSVRGANICRLAIHQPQGRNVIVILSVIDNLVKGAAGQALQCMNLMFGFPENSGLAQTPLSP